MPILQMIVCDICGASQQELAADAGFKGWGALHGIALDGQANPALCPEHLARLAQFADDLKQGREPHPGPGGPPLLAGQGGENGMKTEI